MHCLARITVLKQHCLWSVVRVVIMTMSLCTGRRAMTMATAPQSAQGVGRTATMPFRAYQYHGAKPTAECTGVGAALASDLPAYSSAQGALAALNAPSACLLWQ